MRECLCFFESPTKRGLWLVILCVSFCSLFSCEQDNYRRDSNGDPDRNRGVSILSGDVTLKIHQALDVMINEKFPSCLADQIAAADVAAALGALDDLTNFNLTADNISLRPDMVAGALQVALQLPGHAPVVVNLKDLPRNTTLHYEIYDLLKAELDFSRPGWDVTVEQVRELIESRPELVARLKAVYAAPDWKQCSYDPQYIELETSESCVSVYVYRSALKDDDVRDPYDERRVGTTICGFQTRDEATFEQRARESAELLGPAFVDKLGYRTIFGDFIPGSMPRKVLALGPVGSSPEAVNRGPAIALAFGSGVGRSSGRYDDLGHHLKDPTRVITLWQSQANGMFRNGLYYQPAIYRGEFDPVILGCSRFKMDDQGHLIVQIGFKDSKIDWPTLPAFGRYFNRGELYRLEKTAGGVAFRALEGGKDVVGWFVSPRRQLTQAHLLGQHLILDNLSYHAGRQYPNYRFLQFPRDSNGKLRWEFQYHNTFYKGKVKVFSKQTDTHERRELLWQDMEWQFNPETGWLHAWVKNLEDLHRDYFYYDEGTVKSEQVASDRVKWQDYGWIKDKKQFSLDGYVGWSYTEQNQLVLKPRRGEPESWQSYGAFWFIKVHDNLEKLERGNFPPASKMYFRREVSLRPFESKWWDGFHKEVAAEIYPSTIGL